MQNYNNNLAYDFDLFAPKEKRGEVVELKTSKNVMREDSAASLEKSAMPLRKVISILCVTAMVLAFIGFQLYSNLVGTELTAQIDKAKNQLTELKSEQTRLSMELENLVAYDNIEAAAKELGMQKREVSQTVYVNGGEDDTGVVIDNSGDGIFSVFADWF